MLTTEAQLLGKPRPRRKGWPGAVEETPVAHGGQVAHGQPEVEMSHLTFGDVCVCICVYIYNVSVWVCVCVCATDIVAISWGCNQQRWEHQATII